MDAMPAGRKRSSAATWRTVRRSVLDFFYPPVCAACRVPVSDAHRLCGTCWSKIAFLDGPGCARCGFPFEFDPGAGALCAACQAHPPTFDSARAVLRYDPSSRDTILALKRADRLDLAVPFAGWLERAGRELLAQTDLITPVPLHWRRLWTRRYNQSALLAQRLSLLTGISADLRLLERRRPTPSQGEMPSAKARRRNVRGAFQIYPGKAGQVAGLRVLLIDDVFTTGATVEACSRALKRAGAGKVLVLTLARVVRPMSSYI